MATKLEQARSFKALAADSDMPGVKKSDLYRVDPRLIEEEEGFNLRDYEDPDVIAHIESFARAYLAGQHVPPLLLRTSADGRILVVEGHCRRRGALLAIERGADIKYLDALPFKGNDVERVNVMIKSAEGLKLKPLEIAFGYLRLRRFGHNNVEIGRDQGVTPARVEQLLLLATANSDVHQQVKSGRVAVEAAIEAVRKYGDDAGAFLSGELAKAQAQGKSKVTRGTMRGPSLPPKVVGNVVSAVRGAVESFDRATLKRLASLESKGADELEGVRIEVDAKVLLDLVHATTEIKESEAKLIERKKAAEQRASQKKIDGMDDAAPQAGDEAGNDDAQDEDPLLAQAESLVRALGSGSISHLEQELSVGYNRAASLLVELQSKGVLGQTDSSGNCRVL
ncbi:DNA translocase FtsK [Castellaniella sp.]|uniref:DNA translocase FtsK n=1 Tax=Castellaniella sp. TaxID=1955812 RepID=UPI002AFF94C1|nr:DNA translocase FtsK [Castellaniella sp.]